ncbi:hypothetical protein Slin_3217 [Spirosoma linguale DSM 74]|uniref:Transmembrane protein n=1 Tax=Spirosoma linguale (strain ATCC 33905 / DSM 74 / LMG 10896 / Claus 1) TaxID=504472 RepID=D2QMG5_SPILD|nr:hypothetical protein Slin_3217 [Spirosoma linguale DSM 74]
MPTIIKTILFTAFFAIVFFVAERYSATPWLHPSWKILLIFFLCVSFLTNRLVESGLQDNQERFIPLYMAATVARLILGLAFIGFFLFQHIDQRRTFVLDFLVLYICYTGFEIWTLTRNLRRDS